MNSYTEENYLKAIFKLLEQDNLKVTTNSIAERMNVKASSVTDMLKKLADKKFINYEKYQGVTLTEKGRKTAVSIIRKHRLWEVFLVDKLNFRWNEVHDIAEQLEHIGADQLTERLDKFLDYPEYDPHGDPIPNAKGEIPAIASTLLSEMDEGKTCQVTAVKDTSAVFLQHLEQLSVSIGTKIKVIEKISFDGSMNIQIGKEIKTTVSKKLADNLFVS